MKMVLQTLKLMDTFVKWKTLTAVVADAAVDLLTMKCRVYHGATGQKILDGSNLH